jgi:hypothetical protein
MCRMNLNFKPGGLKLKTLGELLALATETEVKDHENTPHYYVHP